MNCSFSLIEWKSRDHSGQLCLNQMCTAESSPICWSARLPEAAAPFPAPSPSEAARQAVWDTGCPEQQAHLPFVQLLCLQVCSEEAIETLVSLTIKSIHQFSCKVEAAWERWARVLETILFHTGVFLNFNLNYRKPERKWSQRDKLGLPRPC